MQKPDLSKPIAKKEWGELEEYYIQNINNIKIPEDVEPSDIKRIESKLDSMYQEARLDLFYTTRNFDNIHQAYKKLKRALFPIVKGGKNAEEREHMLQDHLLHTTLDKLDENTRKALKLPETPTTIFTLYDVYKERVEFIQTIMDIISDKTSRLITDNEALKVEMRLSNG